MAALAPQRIAWVLWLLLWSAPPASSLPNSHQPPAGQGVEARAQHGPPTAHCGGCAGGAGGRAAAGCPGDPGRGECAATAAAGAPAAGGDGAGSLESMNLHQLVYAGDFAGFKSSLTLLSQHEHFPQLLNALQANDDRGITIAHLLACSGRQVELGQLLDVLFRMQGDGVEVIRRLVLETRNHNACRGRDCDLLSDRPGLYAHGTLHFANPSQQVVLFGDVTPFECAAAHGHVQAMKLLIQGGVSPGKAFEVAQMFSLTQPLYQAIQLANTEGFFAQPQIFLGTPPKHLGLPRQPRVRRDGSPAKQKGSGGVKGGRQGADAKQKAGKEHRPQARAAAPVPAAPGGAGAASAAALLSVAAGLAAPAAGAAPQQANATGGAQAARTARLSEMLDVAALLLLTGMLLLPVWSTLCLLWRRTVRKRAAVAEPARRIKQALLATAGSLAGGHKADGGTSAAAVSTVAPGGGNGNSGNKRSSKQAAPAAGTCAGALRQRKSHSHLNVLVPPASTASGGGPAKGGALAAGAATPDSAASTKSGLPAGLFRGSSNTSSAAAAEQLAAASAAAGRTAAAPPAAAGKLGPGGAASGAAPASAGSAKGGKRSKPAPGAAASGSIGPKDATPAASRTSSNSSSISNADVVRTASRSGSCSATDVDAATASPAAKLAGTPRASAVVEQQPAGNSSSSSSTTKRRLPGSRTAAAAAPAGPEAASAADGAQQAGASAGTATSSAAAFVPAPRQAAAAPAAAAAAASSAAGKAPNKRGSSRQAQAAGGAGGQVQRALSSGPTVGQHQPLPHAPVQLRVLSADHAAQNAKAIAALITPYTPSMASASSAARAGIYQPPGKQQQPGARGPAGCGAACKPPAAAGSCADSVDDVRGRGRDQGAPASVQAQQQKPSNGSSGMGKTLSGPAELPCSADGAAGNRLDVPALQMQLSSECLQPPQPPAPGPSPPNASSSSDRGRGSDRPAAAAAEVPRSPRRQPLPASPALPEGADGSPRQTPLAGGAEAPALVGGPAAVARVATAFAAAPSEASSGSVSSPGGHGGASDAGRPHVAAEGGSEPCAQRPESSSSGGSACSTPLSRAALPEPAPCPTSDAEVLFVSPRQAAASTHSLAAAGQLPMVAPAVARSAAQLLQQQPHPQLQAAVSDAVVAQALDLQSGREMPAQPAHWQQVQLQPQALHLQQQQQQHWAVSAPLSHAQAVPPMALPQQPNGSGPAATSAVALPAGMVALTQATQQQQPQKLVVLVPQHQAVHLVSPGALGMGSSPGPQLVQLQQLPHGARALSGVPASVVRSSQDGAGTMSVVRVALQQQQQQALPVSAPHLIMAPAPLMLSGGMPTPKQPQPVQLVQLQPGPQQQVHLVQLQGGGMATSGAPLMHGLLLRPAIPAPPTSQGAAGPSLVPAPSVGPGPGVAFVASQLMASRPQQSLQMPNGGGAVAVAAVAAAAAKEDAASQRKASAQSAAQQLLAMAPLLKQQPRQQQQQQQDVHAPFDWSQLASELAAGPPGSAAMPGGVATPGAPLARNGLQLTVAVPELSAGAGCLGHSSSESARMAAELDELLQQANMQLGWSAIPAARASESGELAPAAKTPVTPSGGTPASLSRLNAAAAEYTPKGASKSPVVGAGRCSSSSGGGGGAGHLRGLEGLQLPDGFSSD